MKTFCCNYAYCPDYEVFSTNVQAKDKKEAKRKFNELCETNVGDKVALFLYEDIYEVDDE